MKHNYLFLMLMAVSCIQPLLGQKKFEPTLESFEQNYEFPEWFKDAKFGIWSHWGPQAVPRQGDWYAKKLYQEGSMHNIHHLEHYGHPSEFGFKDIIPLWKAERWDPEKLMKLYKKVGAKYFVSMGTHHDNFFLWDSKIHKWNSVAMGPKKDVVGLWQAAAKKEGLRFGVSEHLGASYTWYQPSHGADKEGAKAGVPYDGANEEYQDLYHPKTADDDKGWLTNDSINQQNWKKSITELVDMYHPDLLYSDSPLPFGDVGKQMIAHYYNENMAFNGGNLEAVYNCKKSAPNPMYVMDIERGKVDSISPFPWQTDTSIGDWYYRTGQKYMTSEQVVQMLIDIVSKNGNLLLNIVQTPEGDLEQDVLDILDGIAAWIKDNGEGIYGTRPWVVYGEGPSTEMKQTKGRHGGIKDVSDGLKETDFRFTQKEGAVYAFCMAHPTEGLKIKSLGLDASDTGKKVASVSMLGSKKKLVWKQVGEALVIEQPSKLPAYQTLTFKVEFE